MLIVTQCLGSLERFAAILARQLKYIVKIKNVRSERPAKTLIWALFTRVLYIFVGANMAAFVFRCDPSSSSISHLQVCFAVFIAWNFLVENVCLVVFIYKLTFFPYLNPHRVGDAIDSFKSSNPNSGNFEPRFPLTYLVI